MPPLRALALLALAACASDGAPDDTSSDATSLDADAGDAALEAPDPCVGLGVELGRVEEFPNSTYRVVRAGSVRVVVSRDDAGLYAYSASCTYAPCTLTVAFRGDGVSTCPCHGDQYDFDGQVLTGPATAPLAHFALAVCQRRVFVDPTREVPRTVRTLP